MYAGRMRRRKDGAAFGRTDAGSLTTASSFGRVLLEMTGLRHFMRDFSRRAEGFAFALLEMTALETFYRSR